VCAEMCRGQAGSRAELCRGQAGSRASWDGQAHVLDVEGCNCTDNTGLTRTLKIMGQVTWVTVTINNKKLINKEMYCKVIVKKVAS